MGMLNATELTSIVNFRRDLHRYPELSGCEEKTAARIQSFIQGIGQAEIVENIGGFGLAVHHRFDISGPTILIRCEMDALPIHEINALPYRSIYNGIAHKCGHDGHMAIVMGLLLWLRKQTFSHGHVILLFQPAEETGQGAANIVADERYQQWQPNYSFALHNIPGVPLHSIITVDRSFSATVQSLAINLRGKECHAAQPENGNNPALAISKIIQAVDQLNNANTSSKDFTIITPIHLSMGDKSYGVSPADGEIHFTVRTWTEQAMNSLKQQLLTIIDSVCLARQMKYNLEWLEYFPATLNDTHCNELIRNAARDNELNAVVKPHPFKFGEDFGWFANAGPSAMFGLGAGEGTAALHHNNYDFPDELIETGIAMFGQIITRLLSSPKR